MTLFAVTFAVIFASLALGLSAVAVWLAGTARAEAIAARGELARHRYSHSLGREDDPPARRHGHVTGPDPRVDADAAPPTSELMAQEPHDVSTGELPRPGAIGLPPVRPRPRQ